MTQITGETVFVCFRWGDLYPEVCIERLFYSVKRFFSGKAAFHCFSDRPLDLPAEINQHLLSMGKPFSGNWNKERVFATGFLDLQPGTHIVVLDLDILVTGSLDFLVEYEPKAPLVMAPSAHKNRKGGGHGSVIRVRAGELPMIWDDLLQQDYETLFQELGGEREQAWIDRYFPPGEVATFPAGSIVSFKYQCGSRGWTPFGSLGARIGITDSVWKKAELPSEARVVCFHGKPDLDEVADKRYGRWRHAPFISEFLSALPCD